MCCCSVCVYSLMILFRIPSFALLCHLYCSDLDIFVCTVPLICDLYGLIRLLVMRPLCMFHDLLVVNLYCQFCSIVESIWICLCGIIPTVHSLFCISDAVVLFKYELHCYCVMLLFYSGFCYMICSVASCWLRTNKV